VSATVGSTLAVRRIFIADGHSFFGRHGLPAAPHPIRSVDTVECIAGRGLRGDRFFDFKENYRGQVTLFAEEVFLALCEALRRPDAQPSALRRNLLVAGGELNDLIGQMFELQGVRLEGIEECRPCHWMNAALGPGAEAWLRGRGGLRCRILSDGWLRADRS
jgi:MOSC domain-containing protein YiiM